MCVASQPASASASVTLQIRYPVWLRISRRWFLIWRPAFALAETTGKDAYAHTRILARAVGDRAM